MSAVTTVRTLEASGTQPVKERRVAWFPTREAALEAAGLQR
jgi:hypothetical protein